MKKLLLFLIIPFLSFGQANEDVFDFSEGAVNLFDKINYDKEPLTHNPQNTIFFKIRKNVFDAIYNLKPCSFNVNIPFINDEIISVSLDYFEAFTADFKLARTNSNGFISESYLPKICSYKILGDSHFSGKISLTENTLVAIIKKNGKVFEILKMEDSVYALIDVSDALTTTNFSCDFQDNQAFEQNDFSSINTQNSGEELCINMAIDIDNYTYSELNSDCYNTVEWALITIAGVNEVFKSELEVSIKTDFIHIWETPGPYYSLGEEKSEYLNALDNEVNNGVFEDVENDLFHLFTKKVGGGIANMGMCSDFEVNGIAVSGISSIYSSSLGTVCHELGHNIGSNHTHACVWDPDPEYNFSGGHIDNCNMSSTLFNPETSCYGNPDEISLNTNYEYGTIMSYCHNEPTIPRFLEFHPIVKNQVLIPNLTNSCLGTNCSDIITASCGGTFLPGCIDDSACNYNPEANINNGSCEYPPFGANDCNDDCDTDNNGVCDDTELIYIPDDNFENYLEENGMGDGVVLNDSVLTENVINVEYLTVYSQNISDFTGLEWFLNLKSLQCNANPSYTLDVSNNTELISLYCNYNNLSELNVSNNIELTTLYCFGNNLSELDVSNNIELSTLNCNNNNLSELDVSNNIELTTLKCKNNNLSELDISNNTELAVLHSFNNDLSCIRVWDVEYAIGQEETYDENGDAFFQKDEIAMWSLECIFGCIEPAACNYNPTANIDDYSCSYPDPGYNCEGQCNSDIDGDGICDEFDLGCIDDTACNFDINATTNDPTVCNYVDGICDTCSGETDGTGIIIDNDTDDDGICDSLDPCPDDPINDPDNDGICNNDEIYGCTDEFACNFNMLATEDNGACWYAEINYDCYNNCLNDLDSDNICDEEDNCPNNGNTSQSDSDNDEIGNACDNCLEYFNPDQEDFNNDGIGDACDGISLIENDSKKNLLITIDILGRETRDNKGFQLHIYDDGSIEKKYLIK